MALPPPEDPIVAPATGPGVGARSIVRLTGSGALAIAARLIEGALPAAPARALRVRARLPDGATVPCEVVLMRAPRSYSGQDLVEIHLDGAPPLAAAVATSAIAAGARPAGPGEFTLRAFLGGRMDLVQAEAVAGLIAAQDRAEMRASLRALEGHLSAPLRELERRLLDLCAEVEAAIDFVDQDIGLLDPPRIRRALGEIHAGLADLCLAARERRTAGARPRVVLMGPPNAGKTSLFNALAQVETLAIVSERRGTTRDLLSAPCDAEGRAVELWDTPGLFEQSAGADRKAMERALAHARSADLVLLVAGLDDPAAAQAWEREIPADAPRVRILNKLDLDPRARPGGGIVGVSARTGDGLDRVRAAIRAALPAAGAAAGDFAVSARQVEALRTAEGALRRAAEAAAAELVLETAAADLREALGALGALTGREVSEDVLSRIFERFCIGK
jgi:tRNA modification GTPase